MKRAEDEAVFRAVADPTRRALLELLRGREQSVNELRVRFRMSQPAISQHLGVLRRANLVKARREGRRKMYQLSASPIAKVYQWAETYKLFFDPAGHAWAFGKATKEGGEHGD
jgi:DNA-binding transcriptional ArsR family regulator